MLAVVCWVTFSISRTNCSIVKALFVFSIKLLHFSMNIDKYSFSSIIGCLTSLWSHETGEFDALRKLTSNCANSPKSTTMSPTTNGCIIPSNLVMVFVFLKSTGVQAVTAWLSGCVSLTKVLVWSVTSIAVTISIKLLRIQCDSIRILFHNFKS